MKQLLLCACLGLTACTFSDKEVSFKTSVGALVLGLDNPKGSSQTWTADPDAPTIRLSWPKQDVSVTLTKESHNGNITRYMSNDERAVALQNGVIMKTEGLGVDLTGFKQSENLRPAPAGDITRIHRYLDGEYQTQTIVVSCRRQQSALKTAVINRNVTPVVEYKETCVNETLTYENSYIWIRSTMALWRSRQWVSPEIEDLVINH